MESVVALRPEFWKDKSVSITGHTGFKGSWLALWLSEWGAKVNGLALQPDTSPNHWDLLQLDASDDRGDVRNFDFVLSALSDAQPEIVFHLAAQSLVRRSYREPNETWSTNVMGTVNVLEACRRVKSVKAVVVVTTDKVYADRDWLWGYREDDRLGAHDPYCASKAACEFVAESYRKSFFNSDGSILLATVRAGNVIGGGDWAENRLIPDLVRSVSQSHTLKIRNPQSTRPWQHVLDCLNGYLMVGRKLLEGKRNFAEAWNIGPNAEDHISVLDVLARMKHYWPDIDWVYQSESDLHEANLLYLDNAKSKTMLEWKPVWNLDRSLRATTQWYKRYYSTGECISRQQLLEYFQSLSEAGLG